MHACVRGLAGVPCVSSTYGLTIDGEWLRQRLLGLDFVERALLLPPEMRVERAGMHSLTLEWSAPPTIYPQVSSDRLLHPGEEEEGEGSAVATSVDGRPQNCLSVDP